jgi:hypothetical protein
MLLLRAGEPARANLLQETRVISVFRVQASRGSIGKTFAVSNSSSLMFDEVPCSARQKSLI